MLFHEILIVLMLAHILADFPLQTDWVFRFKSRHWLGIALHASIHGIVTFVLLSGWTEAQVLGYVIFLTVAHFACDWCKVIYYPKNSLSTFLFDQAAHVAILLILAYLIPKPLTVPPSWILYPAFAYGLVSTRKISNILCQSYAQA